MGIIDSLNKRSNFNKHIDDTKSIILLISKILIKDNNIKYIKMIENNIVKLIKYLIVLHKYYYTYKKIKKYINMMMLLTNYMTLI